MYPNPAKEHITIKLGADLQTNKPIEIYSVLGNKVLNIDSSEIKSGYVTKNISALSRGLVKSIRYS